MAGFLYKYGFKNVYVVDGGIVDAAVIETDEHFSEGCAFCHNGDPGAQEKEAAHTGLVGRPSEDPEICGQCHPEISATYQKALHYTAAGLRKGVTARFSEEESVHFDPKIFESPSQLKTDARGKILLKDFQRIGYNKAAIEILNEGDGSHGGKKTIRQKKKIRPLSRSPFRR